MIKLYGFSKNFGLVDASPFVLKTDLYLRMTGVEYKLVNDFNMVRNAPKGKLPVIDDDGELIPDSSFIIKHLKDKHNVDLDAGLTDEQRAIAFLITKSIEEHLYWCLLYSRWVRDESWTRLAPVLFAGLPMPLRLFVPKLVRRNVVKSCDAHGLGRHSEEEVMQIAEESFTRLSDFLGEKAYFLGDKPSSLDASAFGLLSQFMIASFDTPMSDMAKQHSNLLAYCQRVHAEFYG
jgi:glutathione S-transferase